MRKLDECELFSNFEMCFSLYVSAVLFDVRWKTADTLNFMTVLALKGDLSLAVVHQRFSVLSVFSICYMVSSSINF